MARVPARSNIYTVLPILATLIMAGGIAATYICGIKPYQGTPVPSPRPPVEGRQNPDIVRPETTKPPSVDETLLPKEGDEEAPKDVPKEGDKEAPKEGDKEAPKEADKEGDKEAPKEVPKEADKEPPQKKAEEEEEK